MRADLFYRLSGIQLRSPSLREHRSDIPLLIAHFVRQFDKEMNAAITGLSDEAMERCMVYDWPGNIRELKNVLECACSFALGDLIGEEDLPESILAPGPASPDASAPVPGSLAEALNGYERNFISTQAGRYRSLSELADGLGISKQTLNYKIKKLGLSLREQ